jgi:hypothetical protein
VSFRLRGYDRLNPRSEQYGSDCDIVMHALVKTPEHALMNSMDGIRPTATGSATVHRIGLPAKRGFLDDLKHVLWV